MSGNGNGYVCRSRGSDSVTIALGSKMPDMNVETGWWRHLPGWFTTVGARTFKRRYGFGVAPGTVVKIKIGMTLTRSE